MIAGPIWLTFNDDTGDFVNIQDIEAIAAPANGGSLIVTMSGKYQSSLTPTELRGRIDALMARSTN